MGRRLIIHGPAAGRYALRWAPYYLAKFVAVKTVQRYGVFRIYRRAAEAAKRFPPAQQRPFCDALKLAMRAPSRGYEALMRFDAMLWQWIMRTERDEAAADPEMRLLASSAKVLLLSRGSTAPAQLAAGDDAARQPDSQPKPLDKRR